MLLQSPDLDALIWQMLQSPVLDASVGKMLQLPQLQDRAVTVTLQMIEFDLILNAAGAAVGPAGFWKLLIDVMFRLSAPRSASPVSGSCSSTRCPCSRLDRLSTPQSSSPALGSCPRHGAPEIYWN